MGYTFEIKCVGRSANTCFFEAKKKYKLDVNRRTGEGVCSCWGGTSKAGGRKQKDCKHLEKAREIIKVMGWKKTERD